VTGKCWELRRVWPEAKTDPGGRTSLRHKGGERRVKSQIPHAWFQAKKDSLAMTGRSGKQAYLKETLRCKIGTCRAPPRGQTTEARWRTTAIVAGTAVNAPEASRTL